MAGYSGTPLPKKLGIEPGITVGLLNAPNHFDFDFGELPEDVEVVRDSDDAPADIYIIFATRAAEAERAFIRATSLLPPDGAIWVAWPKKASGVDTDILEDTLRDLFLPTGMVDNKVCAIDETWSGLRFVVRKENRDDWSPSTD
jgi:hypothetical protein